MGALRCLASLLWLPFAAARFETGSALAGSSDVSRRWQYVGKFGYGVGTGTYEARVRSQSPLAARLQLQVFLDEDWPLVAALPECSPEVASLARASRDIFSEHEEWGNWAEGTVKQSQRVHIWYFAISGCWDMQDRNATRGVDFEIHYQQTDNSELSYELRLMPSATFLAILCLSGFLVHFARRCCYFRQNIGDVHPVIRTLAAVVLLQWFAEVLHLLHLQLYEHQGFGESALESSSGMLFMLSQVASCTLLIAISKGYTLIDAGDERLVSVKRLAVPVALLHVGLVGHGSWQGEHSDKHHDHEGIAGWAIVAVRLLLYVWFVTSAGSLREQCQSFRLQDFLKRFRLVGSGYFLSYPAIYIVVQAFAPYLQHPILHISTAMMQTSAAVWLSDLFLSRGDYFEVSSLSRSLLPGACGGASARLKSA